MLYTFEPQEDAAMGLWQLAGQSKNQIIVEGRLLCQTRCDFPVEIIVLVAAGLAALRTSTARSRKTRKRINP